ncbi:MAG: response regulator transcription factor [Gemmatimonadaceae bacterium]|nr:response regulator transcription factor [Gemmatimonadaceae bacterium]
MSKGSERRATTAVDRRSRESSQTPAKLFRSEVILVEDDRELADLICFALESVGVTVTIFNNGVDALDGLAALPEREVRRLVLLSVDIGGIDGHTLHERLISLRPDAFLVAFMSSRASEADQIRALRGGAIDYLVKPVSMHVLIEKVRVWQTIISGDQ